MHQRTLRQTRPPSLMAQHRLGIDENGLGARLGPLIVTAAHAQVGERGQRLLKRKLPPRIRADLGDSKALVGHKNIALGEAWARALATQETGNVPSTPQELLELFALDGTTPLKKTCPKSAKAQCWSPSAEMFEADQTQVARVSKHLQWLGEREVELHCVRSRIICTERLNHNKSQGINRFTSDLHGMEELILAAREHACSDLLAVCGKVGGMSRYTPYFGPLGGRLRTALIEGQALSAYVFPGIGEIRFVRDADATDPLVMLASLVGKYLRELTMSRIARHWGGAPRSTGENLEQPVPMASGYHDPVTQRFVRVTALRRREDGFPESCFERVR